ncbi:MAG TPA: hypothetical protein VHW00_13225 [Thermoanaerobaculia bacterium]|nr:hypothetical protein [Thermoanaerobaculia bacterium]
MSTNSWEIPHAGGVGVLTVEAGANGKEMVRLDGRPIARPLDPAEDERELLIGGQMYILRRIPGGFGFDLEFPPPIAQTQHELSPEAASATFMGGLQSAAETLKVSRILWVVAAALIGLMIWGAIPTYEDQARERVELLLREMALGPGPQEELAMGIWMRNTRTPDRDELAWAVGHFPDFRSAKDLRRKFGSWKVLEVEVLEGEKRPTARVTIEVEGKQYKMLVPERQVITWAD